MNLRHGMQARWRLTRNVRNNRFIDFNQGAIEADLSSMTGSLVHRGPDDSGFFTSANSALGFGHRPLDHRPLAARQAADARRR